MGFAGMPVPPIDQRFPRVPSGFVFRLLASQLSSIEAKAQFFI